MAIAGLLSRENLLDIVRNFVVFERDENTGRVIKKVPRYQQFRAVKLAVKRLLEGKTPRERSGIIWHTQGSGKSVSMIFFSQKVLRNVDGNWTFVVVTDRRELDDQIYRNFASSGVVTEARAQATSAANLRQLLSEDHRYVNRRDQKAVRGRV